MKKLIIYIIVVIVFGIVCFFAYEFAGFTMFDVKIEKITEIKVPNKFYRIGLYYLPGNATSQDYIQVKRLGNRDTVLQNYERYNFVSDYRIIDDINLRLILRDTTFSDRKADTVFLKLP